MPQLDPSPWLAIMLFSWLVFLTCPSTKILGHTYPNEQTAQMRQFHQPDAWLWPWL